jgi:single-stranded-DNA-specific exonuclease
MTYPFQRAHNWVSLIAMTAISSAASPTLETVPVERIRPVQWRLRAPAPIAKLEAFSSTLGLPPKIAAILYARGIHSSEALEPELALSPNPALLEAAERIITAINTKKRIRIHGDYDADGITGASLLMLGLRELGANVHTFIPHRLTDGYGVHPDRVPEHLESCDLFITVDCGVSNLAEIALIVAGGAEAIVTDHHAPGHDLPGCLVVHPALAPNFHPDLPALTGSGVAFHLLWAVRQTLGLEPPWDYADLATIGTVADLAPLLGENRALVKFGLARMANSRWIGIRAMVDAKNLKTVSAKDVGFMIAPRINAAGRLGEANVALELLTTDSPRRALELATYLDARNLERKKVQDEMYREALELVDPEAPALVVTKEGWHPGVMGIVASKLLERFFKPVFIIAAGKGSVRSTPGISAVKALNHAASHLKRYGGHTAAGGFALHDTSIPEFRASILEFASLHPEPLETVTCDAMIAPKEISSALIKHLEFLEPFGMGNPAPVFWLRETLEAAGSLGKDGKHFQYRAGGLKGKQWGVGVPFAGGDRVDAAVQVEENVWQGKTSLEFSTVKMRYQSNLRLLEEDLDGGLVYPRQDAKTVLEKLKLEPSAVYAEGVALEFLQKSYPMIPQHSAAEFVPELTLFSMPEPILLEAWILAGVPLKFAFTERTLLEIEGREIWTLEKLKTAEKNRKRGEQYPAMVLELLNELRPLEFDAASAYRASQKLVREEARGYQLERFVQAYRHADDAAFSRIVRVLFAGIEVEKTLSFEH